MYLTRPRSHARFFFFFLVSCLKSDIRREDFFVPLANSPTFTAVKIFHRVNPTGSCTAGTQLWDSREPSGNLRFKTICVSETIFEGFLSFWAIEKRSVVFIKTPLLDNGLITTHVSNRTRRQENRFVRMIRSLPAASHRPLPQSPTTASENIPARYIPCNTPAARPSRELGFSHHMAMQFFWGNRP